MGKHGPGINPLKCVFYVSAGEVLGFVRKKNYSKKGEKTTSPPKNKKQLQSLWDKVRKHELRMNSLKCAFGVSAGEVLSFVIH